ncbi:DUF6458 family protein [Intrasporangium sp.]|uniref:DUF6458 family protein n=1 Tax=Intrasporangium sp. TaxID=1925024 RepID=UPI002939712F|nr:DUF6458 family protein [Intrasporangium sp.]MDV3221379.1 DUF6458 family protein [Intrasporangium sp.]
MGIGLGVTLLVLGAIMTFTGLDESILNTDLDTVGIILMVGGALALIMGIIQNAQRTRRTTVTEHRGEPEVVERRPVVERREEVVDRRDEVVDRRDER